MSITNSLCEFCYRHIPAETFEQDSAVWIKKNCPEHGKQQYMIERSAKFYNSLICDRSAYDPSGYVVEVTDRCNLKCPHCYQEPNNKKIDVSKDLILDQIKHFPKDDYTITLAGAEPTLRKDLFELVTKIKLLGRDVNILTNGVKLSDLNYVKELYRSGCEFVTIGLNHPDYQGSKVHKKQLKGISNCLEVGMRIKNINYTLENFEQLPYILNQIQDFGNTAEEYRIRGGADIGRHPDAPRMFLSDLVYYVEKYAKQHNWSISKPKADDNLYHYMININNISHRLIQWADVKTVDLNELQCGPWGQFVPGAPITNLMHQVILRDRAINKKVILIDKVPEQYKR